MNRVSNALEDATPAVDPVNAYDAFAEAYVAATEDSLVNAHYERPAVLALAGDVAGRRILDAGCGAGALSAALRDRGAVVSGLDASAGMLAVARRRLGDDADLHVVDLRDPLPFADAAFDDVVASLVLHYLEDWGPTLSELRRVLEPGGRLIASIEHPIVAYTFDDPRPDYFATTSYSFAWPGPDGKPVPMRFWRKSLQAMVDAFAAAGFRLSAVNEPQPDPAVRDRFPDDFERLATTPGFLFFVLEARPAEPRD